METWHGVHTQTTIFLPIFSVSLCLLRSEPRGWWTCPFICFGLSCSRKTGSLRTNSYTVWRAETNAFLQLYAGASQPSYLGKPERYLTPQAIWLKWVNKVLNSSPLSPAAVSLQGWSSCQSSTGADNSSQHQTPMASLFSCGYEGNGIRQCHELIIAWTSLYLKKDWEDEAHGSQVCLS